MDSVFLLHIIVLAPPVLCLHPVHAWSNECVGVCLYCNSTCCFIQSDQASKLTGSGTLGFQSGYAPHGYGSIWIWNLIHAVCMNCDWVTDPFLVRNSQANSGCNPVCTFLGVSLIEQNVTRFWIGRHHQTPASGLDPVSVWSFPGMNSSYRSARSPFEDPDYSVQRSSLPATSVWNSIRQACQVCRSQMWLTAKIPRLALWIFSWTRSLALEWSWAHGSSWCPKLRMCGSPPSQQSKQKNVSSPLK